MQTEQLRYRYIENGVEITGYNDYPEVLVIPAEIQGRKVLGIAESAFCGVKTLRQVKIEEGVLYLAPYAFADCPLLEAVTLPRSMQKIGRRAFANLPLLKTQVMSGKIYLGAHIIGHTPDIPERVAINACITVADEAFKNASTVKEIVFFNGVKHLGDFSFYGVSARIAELPQSVLTVGDFAFANNPNLQKIILGEELLSVGEGVVALTPLAEKTEVYSGGVLLLCRTGGKIRVKRGTRLLAAGAFAGCKAESVIVPSGVKSIPCACFLGCERLLEVNAPGVEKVEDGAFALCSALQKTTFSTGVTTAANTFYGTPKEPAAETDEEKVLYAGKRLILAKPTLYGEYKAREGTLYVLESAFEGNGQIVKVSLPQSVRGVAKKAFKNCKNLTALTLPDDLTHIPLCFAEECAQLREVIFAGKVCEVGAKAFYHCEKLSCFPLENAVKVGKEAFAGCKDLSVSLGETLREIGESAFERSGVLHVDVKARKIGKNAFAFARALKTVRLHRLEVIPEGCFYACGALSAVTLPEKGVTIEKNAFALCSYLREINLKNARLSAGAFESCASLREITVGASVPKNCFKNCKKLSALTILSPAKTVGAEAFANCSKLEEVIIPSTLSAIEARAFTECGVKTLALPKGIQLGEKAFYGCQNLKEISVQEGEEERGGVGVSAFENCKALEKAAFEEIVFIHKHAFAHCESLVKIDVGERLESLGEGAFLDDAGLRSLALPSTLKKIGEAPIRGATVRVNELPRLMKEEKGLLLKLGGNTLAYLNGFLLTLPLFDPSCYTNDVWLKKSFSGYDAVFGLDLEDMELKAPYVKSRLLYPYKLNQTNKKRFLEHYFPALAEEAVRERNAAEITAYIKNGCFNAQNLPTAIDLASQLQAVEITAQLLALLKKLK